MCRYGPVFLFVFDTPTLILERSTLQCIVKSILIKTIATGGQIFLIVTQMKR